MKGDEQAENIELTSNKHEAYESKSSPLIQRSSKNEKEIVASLTKHDETP